MSHSRNAAMPIRVDLAGKKKRLTSCTGCRCLRIHPFPYTPPVQNLYIQWRQLQRPPLQMTGWVDWNKKGISGFIYCFCMVYQCFISPLEWSLWCYTPWINQNHQFRCPVQNSSAVLAMTLQLRLLIRCCKEYIFLG